MSPAPLNGGLPGLEWAWLIPALSAIAFLFIVSFGRLLPRHGAFLAPLAIGAGFVVFWFVLSDLLRHGAQTFSITWLEAGATRLTWGMILDPLSVVMLGLVSFVALGIQIYSWAYMAHESRFGWYFAVHALFVASMLALVLADNLLFLYITWELVGICSYLLIGFWYERRPAAEAAKKAFVTTRIGDVGLLIGILLLFRETGTFDLSTILHQAETGGLSGPIVTAASLLIFAGAAGKSAQFPLHVWLPDAMEGPTPVSALIHAATMVAAGVFLVARVFPLFELSSATLIVVASLGLLTALMAGTMALVMTDMKRILAYSTVSNLGFMMLALGAGALGAAMFHLLVHAFAKAMLFLSAGSVTHATEKTDIRDMGGLGKKMPVTALCFTIGAIALSGLPPLSGFFSKDEVLTAVLGGRHPIFLALTLLAALLGALYMARVLLIAFWGSLKDENAHIHESPGLMLLPMVAMAFLALTVGLLALPLAPGFKGFGAFLTSGVERYEFKAWLAVLSTVVVVAGFLLAWLAYVRGTISPARLARRWGWLHQLWVRKYYLDDLYQWAINRVVLAFGEVVALFDRIVVNDAGVNGVAESVVQSGLRLRLHVTGKLYNYALGMVVGVLVVALVWWLTTVTS
ncbi:MAG: NADH-quinone oxidoreductase subunit L [Chloroflexi bacterium]|nr:NADH-quinone oxidoreductase subunit L [Chloroflexota bacterium]